MTRDKKAHKRTLRVTFQGFPSTNKEQLTCWMCDTRMGQHNLAGMCAECAKVCDDSEREAKRE